jgi:hypothetical protein
MKLKNGTFVGDIKILIHFVHNIALEHKKIKRTQKNKQYAVKRDNLYGCIEHL